jgi:hypothetical protein
MKTACSVILTLALAASLFVSPVWATSYSTDQSDLWWVPNESGWGLQIVQRGSVLFVTVFVYGPANTPTWYVATLDPASSGSVTWEGDLYATTGPWFGSVPYDPAQFTARKVGTLTWSPQTLSSARLEYVVDGVALSKSVVRQTLVADNYGGTYLGALHDTTTSCADPGNNVPPFDDPGITISVTQNGQEIVIAISQAGSFMVISGMLAQSGQFGSVIGTYTSSPGEVGNASVSAINVQANSLTGSFSLTSTNIGCKSTGYFSAMRAG